MFLRNGDEANDDEASELTLEEKDLINTKILFNDFDDLFNKIKNDYKYIFKITNCLKQYNDKNNFFDDKNFNLNKYFKEEINKTINLKKFNSKQDKNLNIINSEENFENDIDDLYVDNKISFKKNNKTKYLSIKFKKKYGIDIDIQKLKIEKVNKNDSKLNNTKILDNEINWSEENNSMFIIKSELEKMNKNQSNINPPNMRPSNNVDNISKYLKIKLDKSCLNEKRENIPSQEFSSDKINPVNFESFQDPSHIKDCIYGLNSQYPERVMRTLKALPKIISSQPYDLDFSLESLSEILLKFSNDVVMEKYKNSDNDFDPEKITSIVLAQLTVFNPIKMTQLLCKRFFLEESGIKQKMDILDIILKSCEFLSKEEILDLDLLSNSWNKNTSKKKDIKTKNTSIVKLPNEDGENEKTDKNHTFTLNKNQRRNKGKVNNLFPFIEYIVFPLMRYLEKKNIDFLLKIKEMDFLLAKFLLVIGKIILYSENFPKIYQILFESFELFKAVTKIKENSLAVIDSLNFYIYVVGKFINPQFLEIYPEFMKNFLYCLKFLKFILDEVKNEEIKIEIIKNLNCFIINLKKLRNLSVLAMEGMEGFLVN